GVGEADADVGLAGAQALGDAREGATRADGADEAVDAAAGLFPDFRRRGLDMGLAVGGVVELVGPYGAARLARGQRLGEAARVFHVVVRVAVGHRGDLDQFGTEGAQRVLLFLALGLGDHDHGAETHGRADDREADAGIAGCALDDGAAGGERAAGDGIADDVEGGAVLDRLAGVHELGLAPDL